MLCVTAVSRRYYFIKEGITYSHRSKKFGVQVHYHSKMYKSIAIKISWYMWVEGNFFSSDLYKAEQLFAFKSDLLQPVAP